MAARDERDPFARTDPTGTVMTIGGVDGMLAIAPAGAVGSESA
jgi:hypothetical protein